MRNQKAFTAEQLSELKEARHAVGIYSLKEICGMFDCSRYSIDNAINVGKLDYISPNNRDRYLYLNDFINYMKSQEK